jgi:hypothetical protein
VMRMRRMMIGVDIIGKGGGGGGGVESTTE